MDERDIQKVANAFDRLLAHTAQTCDQTATWPISAAKDDILDILAGEWHADEMTQEEYDRLADMLIDAGLPYGDDCYNSAAYALALEWGQS